MVETLFLVVFKLFCLFILITRTHDLFIPHLKSPVLYKLQVLLNQLCKMSLFTKREQWLIFSSLKKFCFLKSAFLLNFWIPWYSNTLNFRNITMILNKSIIWQFSVDVTIWSPKTNSTRPPRNHFQFNILIQFNYF